MTTIVKCPTCDKPVEWTDKFPDRPFCSARCKLIDLGDWADESHKIPGASPVDFLNSEYKDKLDKTD